MILEKADKQNTTPPFLTVLGTTHDQEEGNTMRHVCHCGEREQ
jgi:hypothetical protein